MDVSVAQPQTSALRIVPRAAQLLAHAALMLVLMVTALHVLLAAAPGDAIDTVTSDPEIRRVLETQWGLAAPLHERIIATVQSLLVGDLGSSWTVQPGQSVASLLYQPAARSGALIAFSLSVTLMLGAGCIWIERRHKHVRPFISVVRTTSLVPVFLIGLGSIGTINALTWYAIDAGWIHRPNFFALPIESSWVPLGLAAFTLGISSGMLNAVYHMFNDALTTLDNSTFVLATKGQLRAPKIHYSRHLILPTMAMTTKRVPLMLGSLVIVDPVFNINGLGRALLFAAEHRDFPVLFGAIIIITILILLLRILSHLMEFIVDPRHRVRS